MLSNLKKYWFVCLKLLVQILLLFLLSQTLLMPNIRKPIDTDRTAVLYI